jgi:hypothetical protein
MNEDRNRDFLVARACTLGEACRGTGHDEGGTRCAWCPLRELCESEDRWLVKRRGTRGRFGRLLDG